MPAGDAVFRRILVAMDAATANEEVFDVVTALAARLEAEVAALFVEDTELLRLGEFDFVKQVTPFGGRAQTFDTASLERELRALATHARRRLEASAARRRVACSFRVVRGQVAHEVAAAAGEADLVVLEGAARPVARHLHIVSPARAAWRACRTALVLKGKAAPRAPVVAVYDGTAEAGHALAHAARMARDLEGELVVLLAPGRGRRADTLEAKVRDALVDQGLHARFEVLSAADPAALLAALRRVGGGVLALAAASPLLEGKAGEDLFDRVSCPLLLVR